MRRYTDTEMGFTSELKVNPNASIEKDEALEKWLESLDKKLKESQRLFKESVDILDDPDKLDMLKAEAKKMIDDIVFMMDIINKYVASKGISLRKYYREFKLDFPNAKNALIQDEDIEQIRTK